MSQANAMFDATVRVERIIWLPGAVSGERLSPDLKEFVEDLDTDPASVVYEAVPELRSIAENDGDEDLFIELAQELLLGATGFLVQGATPTREYVTGGSFFSGWGSYYTKWFRVATEADIAPTIIAWAEDEANKAQAAYAAALSERASTE